MTPASDPPTAKQAERDTHDTALRNAPGSVGIGWFCHLVPFQRSDRAPLGPVPTAMHAERRGQATPLSWLSAAPIGLRVRSTRQRLPFHRCAIVSGVPEPWEDPNAVHVEEDAQATPNRKSPCPPPGLGVRWTVHLRPFQRSASVKKPEPLP
jgi:hypothetical protein